MSYAKFLGFITGMGFGGILAVVVIMRKSHEWGQDERTALVHTKAGQWSFYTSAAVVFLLWVTENVKLGMAEGQVRFFSPLGIAFWAMVLIYLATVAYHGWSTSGSLLPCAGEKRKLLGMVLAGSALTLSELTRMVPAFLYVQIVFCLAGLYLLFSSRRTEATR